MMKANNKLSKIKKNKLKTCFPLKVVLSFNFSIKVVKNDMTRKNSCTHRGKMKNYHTCLK
jgi:hypothetical protein